MNNEIANDQINIRIPKSFKQQLKDHCEKKSDINIDFISVSKFMIEAAKEKIKREQKIISNIQF